MKLYIRHLYQAIVSAHSAAYHTWRFLRNSNISLDNSSKPKLEYHLVRIYHALEKSLSFTNRRKGAGAGNLSSLKSAISKAGNEDGFFIETANYVVRKFEENKVDEFDRSDYSSRNLKGGAFEIDKEDFQLGKLSNPELFFLSRYSLREYEDKTVDGDTVRRAIELSMKTPSVCNRQEWAIYHSCDELVISKALSLQSGNRGFGDKVRNIFIVAVDQRAFIEGKESYQGWIDGGMFAMSIIYSLHSLGIGACCLNWSQTPKVDKELRRILSIEDHHTVCMMISFGYPKEKNKVCVSSRRPVNQILFDLEVK